MADEDPTLTVLDEMVLRELTRSTTTVSAVRLAADLWNPQGLLRSDPVGLLVTIIEDLGARGLLTYRESDIKAYGGSDDRGHMIWHDLPHTIRLSQKGWALMGYGLVHLEAGSPRARRAHEAHRGDMTNYRKHGDQAEGGPVEHEDFATHRANYPHHIHMYGGELEFDMAIQRRRYTRVTPEMEAAVIVYKTQHPEATHADVAEETEVPERTVGYILTELPRLRSMRDADNGTSLKDRIVLYLEQMDFKNVADLRRVLGRADDTHNIVHVLHSLRTEGKVSFEEQSGSKAPIKIRLTRAGQAHIQKLDYDAQRKAEDEREEQAEQERLQIENSAKPPPLDHPQKVQPEREKVEVTDRLTAYKEPKPENGIDWREVNLNKLPEHDPTDPYPLLNAIIEREYRRQMLDDTQTAYLKAAEALKGIDDAAAADLLDKGAKLDIPYPSPIEAEYFRYAKDNAPEKP